MARPRPLLLLLLSLVACTAATGPTRLPVGAVQGPGARSPRLGQVVAVEGVVVGGSADGLGGVFVQDLAGDGDPATSDGLFVELSPGTTAPDRFERVRVVGTVVELGEGAATLTALREARITRLGPTRPAEPQALDTPPDDGDWERYEGMAVTIAAPLTVSGTYSLARFGEITASFDGRLFAPTELAAPGAPAEAVARDNARRRLLLDDGDSRELTTWPWYLPSGVNALQTWRTGTVIRGAEGVIDQRRGEYRLQLTGSLAGRIEQAPRSPAPTVPGDVRVVSLNVLNLFNGDGRQGGFPTARGAQTPAQYQRQQHKLVAAVQALAPDVAALMEVENDGYGPDSALAQFVAALNVAGPISDYRFVDAGHGPGTDAIRVALVYRATRLQPVGKSAVLEGGPFAEHSRVPLAQAFRRGPGPAFVVVANHFKSKSCGRGSDAASGADADRHDGQSCWNAVRVESARRLDAWLETDPTGARTDLSLLVGDFNAYAKEDPIRLLREAGWHDAFAVARVGEPYSYVYDGQAGRLDHALISAPLAARLRGAAEWHSNSDELEAFDYHDGRGDDPYRASDHDPFVLGFDLARPGGRARTARRPSAVECPHTSLT